VAQAVNNILPANGLAVFNISAVLSLLLKLVGESKVVVIDKHAIMIKLELYVLLTSCIGLAIRIPAEYNFVDDV